jgi:hypothetical protein
VSKNKHTVHTHCSIDFLVLSLLQIFNESVFANTDLERLLCASEDRRDPLKLGKTLTECWRDDSPLRVPTPSNNFKANQK